MNDTAPEIADLVREMLKQRSPWERMQMAAQSFEAARTLILASFPPGLSEIETKRRLCERLYGDEVDVDGFVNSLRNKEARR